MDLKSMIEIGGKVEVILERNHTEDLKGFSMVQDVTCEGELIITLPMFEGQPILVNPQDMAKIFFFREEGSFYFHGEITKRFRMKNVAVISIRQTSSIKKIQRRAFYRLRILLPIKFRVLGEQEQGVESPLLDGYCIDISGSGLRLNTDHKLDVNTMIECSISLYNEDHLLVKGKVVRSGLADNLTCKYDLGISFQDINERTRDILIKFIFEKQRELRKKGFI